MKPLLALTAVATLAVSQAANADTLVTDCTFDRDHVKILTTPDASPPSFFIGLDGQRRPDFTIYGHAKVIDSAGVHRGWYEGSADSTRIYEYGGSTTWYLRPSNTKWQRSTVTFPDGKWRAMDCRWSVEGLKSVIELAPNDSSD